MKPFGCSVGAVVVIAFTCFVNKGSAVLCYDCNSAFDPRCGETFDPFSLGIVNCSLKDPLEHMPDVQPAVCRAVKMEIYGKTRVVRQCGYIKDSSSDDLPCQRRTSSENLVVTYCSCTTDLCNAAGTPGVKGLGLLCGLVAVRRLFGELVRV